VEVLVAVGVSVAVLVAVAVAVSVSVGVAVGVLVIVGVVVAVAVSVDVAVGVLVAVEVLVAVAVLVGVGVFVGSSRSTPMAAAPPNAANLGEPGSNPVLPSSGAELSDDSLEDTVESQARPVREAGDAGQPASMDAKRSRKAQKGGKRSNQFLRPDNYIVSAVRCRDVSTEKHSNGMQADRLVVGAPVRCVRWVPGGLRHPEPIAVPDMPGTSRRVVIYRLVDPPSN
jgi:hypothetical protein